jgi:putative flavoprotein involved in K+ transport
MPLQVTGMLMSRLPPRLADRLAALTARRAVGDLRPYGIPPATRLPYSNHHVPTIDVGFLKELKAGHIAVRPALARLTPTGVVYADGREEAFDAVIAATGFTSGLADLLAVPGLLDAEGNPRYPSGQPTPAPGLYFVGYTYSLRGHLFEANRAARRLAPTIARYLGGDRKQVGARA